VPEGALDLSFVDELPIALEALGFARQHHRGQQRAADQADFLAHPVEVASLLERSGYPDHVVAAAILHDVLEKTDVEASDLQDRFGQEVTSLVALVSEDPSIGDEAERKDELRRRVGEAGGSAAAIYAADKVSKVRELRVALATGADPEEVAGKAEQHRRSLHMLEAAPPDDRLVQALRFELEELDQLPPAAATDRRGG
jgi:(p)ppGpp synthase/HD superfamily hydrolase